MLVIVDDKDAVSPLCCAQLAGVGDADVLRHRQGRQRTKGRDGAGDDGASTSSVSTSTAVVAATIGTGR